MRRSTLSTKLFAAALPLVLAVAALLAFTVRNDLRDVQQAENGAELGRVWGPLIEALGAVEGEVAGARAALASLDERRDAIDAADGVLGNLGDAAAIAEEREAAAQYDAATPPLRTEDLAEPRAAADSALDRLVVAVDRLDGADSAKEYVTASRSSLLSGRRIVDRAVLAPDMLVGESDPINAYERASRDLVAIGELLPSEAGDPELGAELLSVLKLARAKLAADDVLTGITAWQADTTAIAPLVSARQSFAELENSIAEFEAVAPEDWLLQYRNSGFGSALAGFRGSLEQAVTAVQTGGAASFDDVAFGELVRQGVGFQNAISQSIVERAEADVAATRSDSLRRTAITLGAVLLAALLAWFITRSITRRIKAVAAGANQVASEQLPALVEALKDPRGKAVLPDFEPVAARGSDELAELAQAFNSMQGTLVDVANEQVEVLRRGVSDIFVTMARRNRSLIDRQLAMLDEYEAEVDDPDILANYYQLDHLATRMRRNSESLLVLANAEPKRKRVKATEIDDVVRASIGEVEDYRRIEIEALESLQVRGNVVADISHLLAELLDNATSFSPPDSVVRVGGRRTGESYMLRIVDDGVGIGTERMRELNELLREPPIVGLSVESTLGMSVVSLLANKHGIKVNLAAGNPGLTVDVVLPSTVFGPIETPMADLRDGPMTPALAAAPTAMVVEEQIVDWEAKPTYTDGDDDFVPEHEQPPIPAPAAYRGPAVDPYDDAPRVTAGDWTKMSLDLAAFRSGMESAAAQPEVAATVDGPVEAAPEASPTVDGDTFEPEASEPVVASFDQSFEPEASEPVVASFEQSFEPEAFEESFDESFEEAFDAFDQAFPEPFTPTLEASRDRAFPEPVVDETVADPEPLFAQPDLTLDLSAFEPTAASTAPVPAESEEPAAAQVPELPLPRLATEVESGTETASGTDASGAETSGTETSATETQSEIAAESQPETPAPTRVRHGEFDRPLAPPLTAAPLTQRPVAPAGALGAPAAPPAPTLPGLPTRNPGSGAPDGGPDRLADNRYAESNGNGHLDEPVDDGAPSALEAALGGALPTRARGNDLVAPIEDPISTTASRLDPEALRERLRAFQSEFQSAHDGQDDRSTANHHSNADLGGDR